VTSLADSLAAAVAAPLPWLAPYLPIAQQLVAPLRSTSVASALNAAHSNIADPWPFVEHSALSAGEPYESFIARTRSIPTRNNGHDLFNGLVWLRYPQTKRRLNALQAQAIAQRGTSGSRGPLRDALTLFDENAAVLQAPAALVDALRRRDWRHLFIELRAQWQAARLTLFGHALLEKLLQPRKPITAHVWLVESTSDDALAEGLTAERLAEKPFLPLPVLGVPGWWPANEAPGFYDDPDVFRTRR
jgi:hypothetical protein